MSFLAAVFLVATAAVLQAVSPVWATLGEARLPFLLVLSVHYALTRSRRQALTVAAAAGLVQDALGMTPLGYSAFCFAAVAAAVHQIRDHVFVQPIHTQMVAGAVANAAAAILLYQLLARGAGLELSAQHAAWRVAGAGLLGGVLAPVELRAVAWLEGQLGLTPREEGEAWR